MSVNMNVHHVERVEMSQHRQDGGAYVLSVVLFFGKDEEVAITAFNDKRIKVVRV